MQMLIRRLTASANVPNLSVPALDLSIVDKGNLYNRVIDLLANAAYYASGILSTVFNTAKYIAVTNPKAIDKQVVNIIGSIAGQAATNAEAVAASDNIVEAANFLGSLNENVYEVSEFMLDLVPVKNRESAKSILDNLHYENVPEQIDKVNTATNDQDLVDATKSLIDAVVTAADDTAKVAVALMTNFISPSSTTAVDASEESRVSGSYRSKSGHQTGYEITRK